MAFVRRIFLFLLVNFLVVLTISVILRVFNIQPYFTRMGFDAKELALFCLVWGMGGAFISLGLSRIMAKWIMGVKVIDPDTTDPMERMLLHKVEELAMRAHLAKTPEVGIYSSPEVNAFATGPTKSRSIVAVSTGLLNRLKDHEVEGVLGHEMSHIASGDMVTMTLLQGVINAFVMFLARILAFALSGLGRGSSEDRRGSYGSYTLFVFLFEMLFMILGSLVTAAYSRFREFRADKGGATYAGKQNMIHALEALQKTLEIRDPAHEKPALQTFKISNPNHGWMRLFATHPPLDERIERLKKAS